jgi:diguanylate cyclase (GGDEF)-like protein
MEQRGDTDIMAVPLGRNRAISERHLKTVTGAAFWYSTTLIVVICSFIPNLEPQNAPFWRLALGIPAVVIGTALWSIGPRLGTRSFQLLIELMMLPALATYLVMIQISPATIAVLFSTLMVLIYAGYFARRLALVLTLFGSTAVALSTLFTYPALATPHITSFLVVFIPTCLITALLLHLQNSETLDALAATRRRALTDPLTGLANLRALELDATRRLTGDSRNPADGLTALLLIDLDNFKSANSRHGHVGGDYALREVARHMLRVAPPGSLVARVGGDEFAVLTDAPSRERAAEIGELLRAGVRAASSVMDMPGVTIDAAVGCAVYPDEGRDLSELLDTADRSMYACKGEKRHPVPNLEPVVEDAVERPPWLDAQTEQTNAEEAEQHRGLEAITGGNLPWVGTRTLYARGSALAWAAGSIVLALSLAMPDAYEGNKLPWWAVLALGFAMTVGCLVVNPQPRTQMHVVYDVAAFFATAGLIALTGGLQSTLTPLLILLVASQAWFWNTRLVAMRLIGPVLVLLSPLVYDSLGTGQESTVMLIALLAECAVIVALVLAMFFDRWLLAALQEQAEELALVDPLTGLANRRAFEEFVGRQLEQAGESHRFAIVMIDLDNFKQVNSTRGHRGGDRVLRQISEELQSVSRKDDCVARIGGDEFAAVLPGVGVDVARTLAERFVNAVAQTTAAREAGVGASAGFALYPAHGRTLDQLVFTADSALMTVKATGKGSAQVARIVSAI